MLVVAAADFRQSVMDDRGQDRQAVFVFDAEGDLSLFKSLLDAEQDAAVAEIAARGHTGVFLADGTAVSVETKPNGGVALCPSARSRLHELESRLAEFQRHLPVVPSRVDPAAFAELWLARRNR